MSKRPWLSKTILTNLLMSLLALVCISCQSWISEHPEALVYLFAGVNILLRLVTKNKISLVD